MVSSDSPKCKLETESMAVVNDLWRGHLVQKHNEEHDIECAFRSSNSAAFC